MIPLLVTVLSYLDDVELGAELRIALADVCLSASYFGLLKWKDHMLKIAQDLGEAEPKFARKHHIRLSEIYRIKSGATLPPMVGLESREIGERIHCGNVVLLRLKFLVDQNISVSQVEAVAQLFQPSGTLSNQERRLVMNIQAIVARAYLHQGDFEEAAKRYSALMQEHISAESQITIDHSILTNYAEALCELGRFSQAIKHIQTEIEYRTSFTGTRLHLTLANAWLMQCLRRYWDSGVVDQTSLREAEEKYQKYLESWNQRFDRHASRFMKYNKYLALAGMAVSKHISTFNQLADTTIPDVMRAWEITRIAALDCSPQPRSAVMVAHYSQSVLAYCFGYEKEAKQFYQSAKTLFENTNKQYHFIGQGTVWLDILRSKAPNILFRFTSIPGVRALWAQRQLAASDLTSESDKETL
ncbi:hypothetical protein BD289DRAFT_262583 [Coniella lustricola]|uniref:Tetratricopeptide repeat protein n=1 Tax=Coniella lustricola TaxID=2025994 RepID=A0A2T3A7R1_9PEZI|nr:hypothetical protein BD289DRAFT_262583 [Coniella lustricola]